MSTEIPIQAIIEKYKQELANANQARMIAETAQEILEAQVEELRMTNAVQSQQIAVLNDALANSNPPAPGWDVPTPGVEVPDATQIAGPDASIDESVAQD